MSPTLYPELNQVLGELVARLKRKLERNFIGAYLQGSFAVGDFDQHSDVDFIVAIEDELTTQQVERLQLMHDQVYQLDSEWAKHLEGSYFPREVLRRPPNRGEQLWYLDHGARALERSDHCNTLLVRWVVREKGLRLAGPPANSLVDPVSTDSLQVEMYTTLSRWGREILTDPAPYNNRFYQGYIVLNYCRWLHDLYRGFPGSKQEGATWAKATLDPQWCGLIDGAWAGRPDPAFQVRQPADPQAFEQTLEFLRYVLEAGRSLAARLQLSFNTDQ